jgi:hypothetical protein
MLCTKCSQNKNTECFYKSSTPRGYQTWCKDCLKIYNQKRYNSDPNVKIRVTVAHKKWKKDNPDKFNQSNSKSHDKAVQINSEYIDAYQLTHPCVDCGESDIDVLEFDHVRGIKKGRICQMKHRVSLETLQEEIEKCDIRCANCHRKRHMNLLRSQNKLR